MQAFTYYNPTRLIFGRQRYDELSKEIPAGSTILMVMGGGSIKKNGVYDQVTSALKDFTVVEFWGIEPNPRVETCRKAIQLGVEKHVDFVLAVGGGSVLDAVKLIAVGIAMPEVDAWNHVLSRHPAKALPYASVMTLPATGSEMNVNSVISREETHEKLAWVAPQFPLFSILDPNCGDTLPISQRAASLADILSHTLEQYLTQPGQSRLMDRWAEGILHTIQEIAPSILQEGKVPADAMDDYFLAATLALNDMICMGVNQDWLTHAIGHEITALTGIAHGASLALIFPAQLRVRFASKQAKLAQMGRRVFGLEGTDEEVAHAAIDRLEALFASLGLATRLDEAGVSEDVQAEIARRFEARQWKLGEAGDVTPSMIAEILRVARPAK